MNTIDPLNDGISSVQLVDYMGDDLTVVNAARVSMAKTSEWEWLWINDDQYSVLAERDKRLIKYLANHDHWTPFSHCMVTLRIKMPIFIARQWFKHQVGFTRNEVSRRYVDDAPEFYVPTEWRLRAENVKQGSSEETVEADLEGARAFYGALGKQYSLLLEEGVAPEMARMILPQSMYTEFWETASLAGYARVAKLRLDAHAQKEVQHYAAAVDQIMRDYFPVSWGALMGYEE